MRGKIAVTTQIGVQVTITAENRDYRKDDTTAAGSYTLWDVRPDGTESALSESLGLGLADLKYEFAQETPGTGITVTATWTDLTGNENGLYALINGSRRRRPQQISSGSQKLR